LDAVAEQVSQALERTRLIEQTQKSAVELQTVARVSSASSSILEPIQLLQSVVDLAKNSFNLYHAHVYLLDESGEKLNLTVGAGETGRKMVAEGWSIQIDKESIVARAARLRQGQIVNDIRQVDEFLPNPILPDTLSEMAVPMIVGSRLLGVFDAQSDRLNFFTEDDLRTYSTLASQTSIALQNAQLFAEQAITVERLRELDHLKSSFMANMSHELRTPLNSILGFTQVILEGIDGPLTDFMEADLQLIEKNGKHLLNLINEVLDMAKIESGRLSLTFEAINLRELLVDVLETTTPQASAKGIYLETDADSADDLVVNADQIRIRQVMLNLVGNAIKFTETGGITVQIKKTGDWVRMQFRDTGIGVPIDKLETIFEAFSQVDTSTTRKAGGTGLGLPISRRLVEMHGGRLWAESKGVAGAGSIFHLDIPVHPPMK
jgi:signal transduction histidine kinase